MINNANGADKAQEVETSQEVDVVQMILNDRKSKLPNASDAIGITIITPEGFFLENNRMGAMKIATFRQLMNSLTSKQLHDFKTFIERLNEGASIRFNGYAYGTGEVKMFYANIDYKKGSEPFSLPAVDNMFVFLGFYRSGKLTCNFTMKELYDIAQD